MSHGHSLLINHILLQENLKGKTIIEIGSVREDLHGQNSTESFIKLCLEKDMKLISVDMDIKCSDNAKKLFDKYNFTNGEIITKKGEDYFKEINSFDFIYLDGYDYDHKKHAENRQHSYQREFGKEINNDDCWNSHLLMVQELCKKKIDKHSLICFDDIISESIGKGVTAIPYLNSNGWNVIEKTAQAWIFNHNDNNSEIFVLGNGRSLKGFDFNYLKDKEWVGTTLAYRYWNEVNIYPQHYVNVDSVVIKKNIDDIMYLIKNKKCANFILCKSVLEYCDEIKEYCGADDSPVKFLQDLQKTPLNPFRYLVDWCSGSVSVLWAYLCKKDKINILGMDCKYVEAIPECIQLNDNTLKIIEPVKDNPNYFFDSYQQVGDIYNVPNANSVHKMSWFHIRNICILYNILQQKNIEVTNYNSVKTLEEFFETKDLKDLKDYDFMN